MNQSSKYLIKQLEQYGFFYKRAKGSHQIYFNPITNTTVVVPVHGGKDIKLGTLLAIIKHAGINKNDY